MPYKTDENGNIVAQDGKPVYVKDDGTETFVDFDNLVQQVNLTRSESKARKEKLREIESAYGKWKDFEGKDPEEIKKALEIVENLNQKELVKAGERDEAIRQAVENTEKKFKPMLTGFEQKMNELQTELEAKKRMLEDQVIDRSLSNSPYLDRVSNMTPDVRQAIFRKHFRVEEVNGQMKAVAYKDDGEKLYSPSNPAQLCDTEEALQILWSQYPYKDVYSKTQNSGSGSMGNTGGSNISTFTRSEWTAKVQGAKTKQEQAELAQLVYSGKVKIK